MAGLFGESAALLQGANTAASNYQQNQTAQEAERNKLFLGGQNNLTQMMGQVMQDQGAMARQKEANQAQMVDITPEIANGLVKTTGDPGWKDAVGQKMPVPVYTVLATKAAQEKVLKAKWKESKVIKGDKEQTVWVNEEDPTQRIELGEPGKRSESVAAGRSADIDERQRRSLIRQYGKDFDNDKEVVSAFTALTQSKRARKVLDSGNPIGDASVKVIAARAAGEVGNLAQPEQNAFGGSPALTTWIKRNARRLADGKLDEEDRQYLNELFTVYENYANSKIEQRHKYHAERYSRHADVDMKNAMLDIGNISTLGVKSPGAGGDDNDPMGIR